MEVPLWVLRVAEVLLWVLREAVVPLWVLRVAVGLPLTPPEQVVKVSFPPRAGSPLPIQVHLPLQASFSWAVEVVFLIWEVERVWAWISKAAQLLLEKDGQLSISSYPGPRPQQLLQLQGQLLMQS